MRSCECKKRLRLKQTIKTDNPEEDYAEGEPDDPYGPEDESLASITQKGEIQWIHCPVSPVTTAWANPESCENSSPLPPFEYFKNYVPDEMFELMANMTNFYAVQKQTQSFKSASVYEMQALVGQYLAMGALKFPRVQISGMAYDVIIYQGSKTKISPQNKTRLGYGAAVILQLCQRMNPPNHKLFFDNYFTTYNLLEVQIHAAGTARVNRFANPPLKLDKEMSKSLFGISGIISFIAALKLHRLTERVANFPENVFQFVTLEEHYGFSFWLCVASTATHGANFLVVAITGIRFPKVKIKKAEEPTVTADDLLY
ncbi:UNVERIFIED_CONTAM: hypothetical protein FKN15_023542 [Acipenser sinensis]